MIIWWGVSNKRHLVDAGYSLFFFFTLAPVLFIKKGEVRFQCFLELVLQ